MRRRRRRGPLANVDRGRPAPRTSIVPTRLTASPRQTNVRRIRWPYVPLRSRPWVIPTWMSGRGRGVLEVAQLEGRRRGARGVILVGQRRAEHAVQVGALVAERQLEDVAAVAVEDLLGLDDEVVELDVGVVIVVVVDAAEPQEHRDRPAAARPGTRRGRSASARRPPAAATAGRRSSGSGGGSSTGTSSHLDRHPLRRRRSAARSPRRRVPRTASTRSPSAATADGSRTTSPFSRVVLRVREVVDEAPGEDVDELDLAASPTTKRRAGPTAIATFIARRDRGARRACHRADPGHGRLHGQGAGGSAAPVVAIDPAGDRVTREVDDVAAEPVELAMTALMTSSSDRRQLLGATLRARAPSRAPRSAA